MIPWNHKFEVGIERIDAQHHIFLETIGDFQDARQAGASVDRLETILNEIALYAKYHFFCEENIMRDIGYPDLEPHRARHLALIDELGMRMLTLKSGAQTGEEVEEFLIRWFSEHTAQSDMRISHFVHSIRR